jgi:hypothetical protein
MTKHASLLGKKAYASMLGSAKNIGGGPIIWLLLKKKKRQLVMGASPHYLIELSIPR